MTTETEKQVCKLGIRRRFNNEFSETYAEEDDVVRTEMREVSLGQYLSELPVSCGAVIKHYSSG